MEKRYNFAENEIKMQEFWKEEHVYRFDKNAEGELYSIDTPPATVSGNLHIGHLFSYTQAEIIARFHRMQGENVFYPFGFDDNGLPTERLVEKNKGIRAASIPCNEFIQECISLTDEYEKDYQNFWTSLGFSADWDLKYKTISPEITKISQGLFIELIKMGKAYCKEAPVLWCTECKTSIAQAELDSSEIEAAFNYIPFISEGDIIEVATTRPELLYGCTCLFVNPDDKRYSKYIGKTAAVPLYNYEIPIMSDRDVDMDKGTGAVMCATFGDSTDTEWYNRYNLPYRKIILPDGTISDDVPFIGGLNVFAARKKIISLLSEKGLLSKSEIITHSVASHERCGKPVEIIPSRQWYIDILSEKERFLQAADKINWYPENMKKRYTAWVENLKWDWCISRQRYFGVPFPVWYCKACGKPVFAKPEQLPVNPMETLYKGSCTCGNTEFVPETAVFDTWATSSITPKINERLGLKLTPMTMRTHAHEIIRTWTFYTIVRSLYHTGEIPWKNLMICGFVLAKKGEKISKSKSNNALDPKHLIKTHSADVLRYWTAGTKLGADTFFSPEELNIPKRFVTKLWNASKFAISHLQDYDPYMAAGHSQNLLPVDRWIIERVCESTANAEKSLREYEISPARHQIDELFWKDFCDNYIEIVKERLYEPDKHGTENRKSAQYALYFTLLNILKLYSIYVPHITEYIYQDFFRQYENKASIHQTHWIKHGKLDTELLQFGDSLKDNIFAIRKYKSENNLSMKAEIDSFEVSASPRFEEWFKESEKDLLACTSAKKIIYKFG